MSAAVVLAFVAAVAAAVFPADIRLVTRPNAVPGDPSIIVGEPGQLDREFRPIGVGGPDPQLVMGRRIPAPF